MKTIKTERQILYISFWAGLLFVIAEVLMALYTHSQSVLMDAANDATELVIIIFTLFLMPLFHRPVSEKRPYGFFQVESVFVIIKGFMMLAVTLGLSVNSISVALSGGRRVNAGQVSLFELVLTLACISVYLSMRHLNRNISSPTVHSELLGWKLDIIYGAGMSCAFFASTFLEKSPLAFLAPYFDPIASLVIVALSLPENLKMLWDGMHDLFLFAPGADVTADIKSRCDGIMESFGFTPEFYDITRTGRRLWVEIYFTAAGDTLSIKALKAATADVNRALAEEYENCNCELIVATDEAAALENAELLESADVSALNTVSTADAEASISAQAQQDTPL